VEITLTYGLSNFPNFAHAEFITLGAFIGYMVAEQLGLGMPAALVVSFLCTGVELYLAFTEKSSPLHTGMQFEI